MIVRPDVAAQHRVFLIKTRLQAVLNAPMQAGLVWFG